MYSDPMYVVQFFANGVTKNLQIVQRAGVRYELRGSLPTNVIREASEPEERARREPLPPPYFSSVKSN